MDKYNLKRAQNNAIRPNDRLCMQARTEFSCVFLCGSRGDSERIPFAERQPKSSSSRDDGSCKVPTDSALNQICQDCCTM